MDLTILQNSPLFKGLSQSIINDLFSQIHIQTKKFKPGSMVAQSGELINGLLIVLRGTVKGEMIDYTGKVIKIEDIQAPGALASAFIFGSTNKFPVNVVSVSASEILIIEKSDFLRLLMKNDTLLLNYLNMISNRSQFLSEKIKFLNFKTIRGKLAQYLLQLSDEKKDNCKFDKTQNELADYFGVARPSVGRALGEMEERGLIESKGKYVKILNRKGLSEILFE